MSIAKATTVLFVDRPRDDRKMPLSLSDHQLALVSDAAKSLSPEKRGVYLQRIAAVLELRGRFSDDDVAVVAKLALTGGGDAPALRQDLCASWCGARSLQSIRRVF